MNEPLCDGFRISGNRSSGRDALRLLMLADRDQAGSAADIAAVGGAAPRQQQERRHSRKQGEPAHRVQSAGSWVDDQPPPRAAIRSRDATMRFIWLVIRVVRAERAVLWATTTVV